jgi:hypothetical protein
MKRKGNRSTSNKKSARRQVTVKADDSWCRSLVGCTVGNYRLVKFIGAGKIGYVYRAEHTDFPGAAWALKLIFDTLKPGWEIELKKVIALALVPGVVHFHELGPAKLTHTGDTHLCQYTVWDYIAPGENLKQHLTRVKEIQTSFLIAVAERILHVLHACNEKGVRQHGDLHAGNILIGDATAAILDDSLQRRFPIFVSDFGYGATGATRLPKDDYTGLARIINEMLPKVTWDTATASDRQILQAIRRDLGKLLNEPAGAERRPPFDLLRALNEIKQRPLVPFRSPLERRADVGSGVSPPAPREAPSVGQFQVSEMIGDRWDWWKRLFVPTVPARSKILALDIPTVVTGPRGCGKTMLFRRLSERLAVECGEVADLHFGERFIALYVNANDFADAFAHFPEQPGADDEARLICYANLCILGDLLAVQSARAGRFDDRPTDKLLGLVQDWLILDVDKTLVESEDRLERYRSVLEQIKWRFPVGHFSVPFPGYDELSQHRWLPNFLGQVGELCPWIGGRNVLLFIDDYSTPRVTQSMQLVLNRLLLQRSPWFLAKLATEASSTFVSEDSSGKNLEDGDDYQLVDMGEESLFLPDAERLAFLNEVFSRRLAVDPRIPKGCNSLSALLDRMPLSKTEFARRLRDLPVDQPASTRPAVESASQRRGRSRGRVNYFGENVFSDLWSGDTRTMIQLITDVVDQASEASLPSTESRAIALPVSPEVQDRAYRNRGGEWLNAHTRSEPTDPKQIQRELARLQDSKRNYRLSGGTYGEHLKAIVEAFVAAAKSLLLGPTYKIGEDAGAREVPRMAFRIEIIDEFRIDGLAREVYRDLIRYGLFMRDNRGKSVRGAFVPRLYLRRLLLPFCTLALSKRDSVQLTREAFTKLLLEPDAFKASFAARRAGGVAENDHQMPMQFATTQSEAPDPSYNDLDDDKQPGRTSDDDEERS